MVSLRVADRDLDKAHGSVPCRGGGHVRNRDRLAVAHGTPAGDDDPHALRHAGHDEPLGGVVDQFHPGEAGATLSAPTTRRPITPSSDSVMTDRGTVTAFTGRV